MAEPLTLSERITLTTAAVAAVGPRTDENEATWEEEVTDTAVDLGIMASDFGSVGKALNTLDKCKTFVATVRGAKKESSSQRVVVSLETKPSKWSPEGKEVARTERLDKFDGTGVKTARLARALIGWRCMIWIEMEETDDGGKVRVLRHLKGLSLADDSKGSND